MERLIAGKWMIAHLTAFITLSSWWVPLLLLAEKGGESMRAPAFAFKSDTSRRHLHIPLSTQ